MLAAGIAQQKEEARIAAEAEAARVAAETAAAAERLMERWAEEEQNLRYGS